MAEYLANPKFIQALETVLARAYEAWRDTGPGDAELRECIWHRVQAFEEIRAELHTAVDSGTFAQQEIEANNFTYHLG